MDNEKDLKLNEAEVNAEAPAEAPAVPKRKPVIRKVSAAPTKFAPKRPGADGAAAAPVKLMPMDDDFSDEDDEAAYAAAFEEE